MKLDTTTRKLEVLLAATVSSAACQVVACYRDENRNAPQNLGAVPSATQAVTVSSATVTTFLLAPSVNTIVRVPERISFKNTDTGTVIPTFRLNDNATTYQFLSPTLLMGESVFYDEGRGWYALDASGNLKESLAAATNWGVTGNLTVGGNTTLGDAAADSLTINAGVISYPNIPAFLAYNSATDANVTGNGASVTVDFDTEIFDQGGNFASDTFTAPVTGRYQFNATVLITDLSIAASQFEVNIVTSNRTYGLQTGATVQAGLNQWNGMNSVVADMDAGDTATVTAKVAGMVGDTADVFGSGTNNYTRFSGMQVA